jgi:lipopolysaccharide transport system ATP-binding protein
MNGGDVKISVRGLTKRFPMQRRNKVKGLSTEGVAALGYLMRQTLWPRKEIRDEDSSASFVALDDVSFDVRAGEVLGIIGRNGAGKSTLLRILARVLDPSAGSVTIRGRVVSLLELGTGFAPEMTVRENVQIYGRLAGFSARKIQESESAVIEFAGLGDFRDVPLRSCPSGSAVQLAFSAMVNLEAQIILADEVLAVGDSRFRRTCEERVRAAGHSGEVVLFVSHDMNAIRRICTRAIWIDRGRIVRDGPVGEVVDEYTSELLAGHLLSQDESADSGMPCRILDLRLLDAAHAQVGALQITEDGYIDSVVRVEKPKTAVMLRMELWQGRNHILSSASDYRMSMAAGELFRAAIHVPADFLNETGYRAICQLFAADFSRDDATLVKCAEQSLEFSVMNPHPEESVWANWAWSRDGLVSPRLTWRMETVGPHSPAR